MILLIWILINLYLLPVVSAQEALYRALERTPEEILTAGRESWRFTDFEIYTWDKLDRVLIFDFASYAVQDRFFKRLAFFSEKLGYSNRISQLADITGMHGYNAHNYATRDLARFFNLAAGDLSREEQLLKDILVANGILGQREEGVSPNKGGLISVSRTSGESLRRFLLIHELMHGIYYTLPAFREGVKQLWLGLSEDEKKFWILYLEGRDYDIEIPDLVFNEFQAYLLQQKQDSINWYLRDRAVAEIKKLRPAQSAFVARFSDSCANCLLLEAIRVENLLQQASRQYGFDFPGYINRMKRY